MCLPGQSALIISGAEFWLHFCTGVLAWAPKSFELGWATCPLMVLLALTLFTSKILRLLQMLAALG